MGRYRSMGEGSSRVRHKMILSLISSVLFASVALGAPGASNYGAAAVVGPAKQIASPSIQCRTEYVTLWDTEYQEKEEQVCVTEYEKQCTQRIQRLCQPTTRQECHTEYEQQCNTIYKNVCVQKFRTEYEPYTESECTTEYKQDCQFEWRGHGNDKVWAPIEGTCQNVPYDECRDVQKTHAKQVAYQECNDVPEQKCVSVPKQVCDEGSVHAPLAAAVHHAPVHQAAPSVQDLLNYGVPAVPTQAVPEVILARDEQKLQNAANDDRIVFG